MSRRRARRRDRDSLRQPIEVERSGAGELRALLATKHSGLALSDVYND